MKRDGEPALVLFLSRFSHHSSFPENKSKQRHHPHISLERIDRRVSRLTFQIGVGQMPVAGAADQEELIVKLPRGAEARLEDIVKIRAGVGGTMIGV